MGDVSFEGVTFLGGGGGGGDGDPTIVEISASYDILVGDDIILSTGTHTVKMPLLANAVRDVVIKSVSGTITIDGNGSSVEGGLTITTTQARRFAPETTGWKEIT